MKIGVVSGSVRNKSESARISGVVESELKEIGKDISPSVFLLNGLSLPSWSEDKWREDSDLNETWQPISKRLAACDGFVFVCPEWAGMVPPHLKNMLLMCENGELAHKPALIVAISSSMGGSYPVAELRMSGYKNNFVWWMPDHLIIREVKDRFLPDKDGDPTDHKVRERMEYSLRFLVEASGAIKPVRERCQDLGKYHFGM